MEIKLSVIMPVYNAEKYLHQCLDSVLSQSLREIELICVNDCSKDSSAAILEEYAAEDSRVIVISNESNKHAGPCRNIGLERASGEYVLFMDSDDWLKEGSLEAVYKSASGLGADVLRCKALDYNNETGAVSSSLHNALKRVPFFMYNRPLNFEKAWWLLPKMNVAPWGGICRRQFLTENGIKFNDLVCVNDRSFFWETVIKAEKLVFSPEQLIFYRTNLSTSLVGSRIRNFYCHFRSFDLVKALTDALPTQKRRNVLDAELQDIANWLRQAAKTDYAESILSETADFIDNIERSLPDGFLNRAKGFKQIIGIISK